jgi:hypothetical protein|tara:strand:- start:78 stop:179 length:102 start_codon:yes stop_codon:yes gene_type:complete
MGLIFVSKGANLAIGGKEELFGAPRKEKGRGKF